jgi:hypothetical protein
VDWDRRYWSRKRSDIDQELADFRAGIGRYFSITFDLQKSVMLVALEFAPSRRTPHREPGSNLDPSNNCRGAQTNPDATQEDEFDAGACFMRNKCVR